MNMQTFALQIFRDLEQGTDAWKMARLGIPTASNFSTVMASGKSGGPSLTRAKYMRELVGERITGAVADGYSNPHMDRGHEMEVAARELYTFVSDEPVEQVGFIRNGDKGYSPDGLVGKNGLVEFKSALPHILVDILDKDRAPPEHTAQCQGGLWVAEREWIDLNVYWPKMPPFKARIYRDEPYIANMAKAVKLFNEELAELEARVRAFAGETSQVAA